MRRAAGSSPSSGRSRCAASPSLLIGTVGLRVQTWPAPEDFLAGFDPDSVGAVVLDVRMPGTSALTVLETLVARGVDQPVIMLTGHGTVDLCRRAFKAGAAYFLEKPVDDELLLEVLQKAVRRHVGARAYVPGWAAGAVLPRLCSPIGCADPPPENRMNKLSILAATLILTAGAAQAQVISQRSIGLELANRLASGAVQACADKGFAVSATVVDRAGLVRAVQRADNAGPHTLAASQQKAFTSASARNTTLAMMEAAQKNPGAANLTDIPGFLLLGGGVPVKAGDEVIGAIGIGGAPGGHLDEQCALAAIEGAAELLK